ncbi:MAG TPA: hypothetical protein VK166_10710 [Chitinophagaceae bacterium]|nr:hypothetical protein [Chitinophagaceae bacterium]
MKLICFLTLCLLSNFLVRAQEQKKVYTVNAGQTLDQGLPVEVRYAYPEFKAGSAHFRAGTQVGSKLNFSFVHEEMQFINGADTLAVDREGDIRFIAIEADTFYFQKFWIRQIAVSAKSRLGVKRSLVLAKAEKEGAFGQMSAGTSIDAVEKLNTPNAVARKLTLNEVLSFTTVDLYYFADKFGNFTQASKKNLVNMFGNSTPGFEKFLEKNKFNYNKEADMKAIFDYLSDH